MTTKDEEIRAGLYRTLKTWGPIPLQKLPDYLGEPISAIRPVVYDQVRRDLLTLVMPEGKVVLLRPMGDPVTLTTQQQINALSKPPQPIEAVPTPLNDYTHAYAPYLPALEQGAPPSCVGHSHAALVYLSYLTVTTDLPAPGADISRNVRCNDGGFSYDRLYRPLPSPWWIYQAARKVGGMADTAYGARSHDAIEVLQQIGSLPWNYCLTPKTLPAPVLWPMHGNREETFRYLSQISSLHKVDSMAFANGSEAVCDLIQRYGAATTEIDVFPSIVQARDGRIRMPEKDETRIGRHGLLLYGFNRTQQVFRYLNSMSGLPSRGVMPFVYLDRFASLSFAIMDREEPLMPTEEESTVTAPPVSGGLLNRLKSIVGGGR